MKNNTNKKSKSGVLSGGNHLAIEREIIQAAAKLNQSNQRKSSPKVQPRGKTINKFDLFDIKSPKSRKKSPTGAFYNDGFDMISKPERDIVRTEQFDELVESINGSALFSIFARPLNPGMASTFPRLSKLVQLYEKYQFEELEFYFLHDVSQFATQGANGLVILSALYDAKSASPTLKQEVEATQPHVIAMPNQNSLLRLNKKRMHPDGMPLYVRTGTLPGSTDIKTYDAGNLYVTCQGMANSNEIGELHVRGRVKLFGDILDASDTNAPANLTTYNTRDAAMHTIPNGIPTLCPLATQVTNGIDVDNQSGVLVPPAGDYIFWVWCTVENSVNEAFSAELSVQINNIDFDLVQRPEFAVSGSGAGQQFSLSTHGFRRFNGSDFLTVLVHANGATGVLQTFANVLMKSA